MKIRAATRGSALALWQTEHVAQLLSQVARDVEVEIVVVETSGDRQSDRPIRELGGKGVFVKEVQAAVLEGRADLAVHSAKDLPAVTPDGLVIAAVPERGDPRDALVGSQLDAIPVGGTVATGSVRRRVQLSNLRPDLVFAELRGNIATRLDKAAGFDAIVMAAAALERLGLSGRAADLLDPSVMIPQVAQGALAIECAERNAELRRLLEPLEDEPSRRAVDAERAFLEELGGDCDLPAGAYAIPDDDGGLVLEGMLASPDGHAIVRDRREGTNGVELGRALARHLLDAVGGS